MRVICLRFEARPKGTQLGLADFLVQDLGLIVRGCSVHRHDGGSRWVSLPAKARIDKHNMLVIEHNRPVFESVLKFADDEAKTRFRDAALDAIERHQLGIDGGVPEILPV